MYNIIAYYYLQDKKDNENAKRNFEKYIELYPDGINPYDSMGEFYLLTDDLENAEKYYKKALEKYPFNSSSQEALKKIEEAKKKTSSN
ncbi:MAG: tetratricopeptide repeat protein, partial [Flavisolibacter sp.]|nr:tetratricopeptide repeat protein [Flavisolibacter sp.]